MKTYIKTPLLLLLTAAACRWSMAQVAPQATPTTGKPATQSTIPVTSAAATEDDEITRLTPFEITATKDSGYQATETLAGTRIRTDLRDVGSAITVVTKEFLRDVGATDNTSLLQYTPNAEVGGLHTTYSGLGNGTTVSELATLGNPSSNTRVRGLSAADNTRDFFATDIPWDGYNVDRIDIQRGPNSILFGLGKPAGIINGSMRGAEFRNLGEVSARAGSWGTQRYNVDINQVLIPKMLAIRVDALYSKEKFRQDPAYAQDRRQYGAVRFDPKLFKNSSAHTIIRAKYEHAALDSNRPRVVPPNDFLSAWFRNPTDKWGGLGKQTFDPYDVENQQKIAGDNKGQARTSDPEYNAWVGAFGNQQQPIFFMDGTSAKAYQIYGGYINRQALSSTGVVDGTISAIPYSDMFLAVASLPSYATGMTLPGYQYGQYRQQSLLDRSVFDFRNNLIDGPNKIEASHWNTFNISLSQTAFNDRVGFEATYDLQKYYRMQDALFGNPGINVDLLARFQDFSTNPNVGRPYITGSGGGFSYGSRREHERVTAFGEFRADDVLERGTWLAKLIGKHRFNGVFSREQYASENRQWLDYANAASYDVLAFGSPQGFTERPIQAIIYLGGSLANRSSASGANIPNVRAPIVLNDGQLYYSSGVWNNTRVNPGDAWDRASDPVWGKFAEGSGTTQSENPANYVGWGNGAMDILRYRDGAAELTTSANKALRRTESWAGTWQSYWWNGAVVGTFGWRYDSVKSKDAQAQKNANNRSYLTLDDSVYRLPDTWRKFKDHSVSWGGVVHLNKLMPHDYLPINVSLSYNRSSNFEISGARTDLYGSSLPNPTGKTKDVGLRLSTKDDKYSFRITKYEASVKDGSSSGFNSSYLGGVLARGLAWTNVFQYNLGNGGYTMDFANVGDAGRYNYAPGTGETQAQADAREAAAISAWRELGTKVDQRIYSTWGFDPSKVYNYVTAVTQPASFSITEDTKSKGYEYEFTANPLPNWRITANASQTEAFRNNIGGEILKNYIGLIDHYMNDTAAGDLRVFYGNADATTMKIQWNSNFSGYWALKKLQEGSAVPEIRKWRYNLANTYTFPRGYLKNVSVGGAYRWEDKVVIGYPVITDSKNVSSFDLSRPYYGPHEDAVDLWVAYQRKITKGITWKIQFNVRNAFAKDKLIPISVEPDGSTWASVRMSPDRDWFVTNTFSF